MTTNPTLTITADGLDLAVSFDRWDAYQNDRVRWAWRIAAAGTADVLAYGTDLTTVCPDGRPNMAEALAALLDFLAADVERIEHARRTGTTPEPGTFPTEMHDRCSFDPDALALLAAELDSTRNI